MYRIVLNIIILFCVIEGWWFFALPLALVCVWRFPLFVEIIVFGVVYDLLFGMVENVSIWGYVGIFIGVVIFAFTTILKKIVRK